MVFQPRITISIIIPTCNRHCALERCLDSLAAQNIPGADFEVIVVNDGGSCLPPGTGASLQRVASLVLLEQANRGPAAARNLASRTAQGNFLAFIDDDCAAASDWLASLLRALEKEPDQIVGGCTLNGLTENIYAQANAELTDFLLHYYHLSPGKKSQPPFFSTNNMALNRQAFQAVGGFDERLRTAEDRDLCARLREAGFTFTYSSDMLVYHFHSLNLKGFLGLHFRYGRGNYLFHHYRKVQGWGNYRLEPFRFYSGMLRYPFQAFPGRKALLLSALLVLSQAGNVSGFFAQFVSQQLQRK